MSGLNDGMNKVSEIQTCDVWRNPISRQKHPWFMGFDELILSLNIKSWPFRQIVCIIDVPGSCFWKTILFSRAAEAGSLGELKEQWRDTASLPEPLRPMSQNGRSICPADPSCVTSILCAFIKYLQSTHCVQGDVVPGEEMGKPWPLDLSHS